MQKSPSRKILILIGPSYVGKSTLAAEFCNKHSEIELISFQNYREILERSNFNYLTEVIRFSVHWRRVLFSLLFNRCCWDLPLIQRVLKYGFIYFLLLRSTKFIQNKICLFDEDFIKKLIDSTPTKLNFSDYQQAKEKLSQQITCLISGYVRSSKLISYEYIIAECSYKIAKARAAQRYSQAGLPFLGKEFRNRYTLERQLYKTATATLIQCGINHTIIRTDAPPEFPASFF